jgi:hypothetical protein
MIRHPLAAAVAVALGVPLADATVVFAQQIDTSGGASTGGQGGAGASGGQAGGQGAGQGTGQAAPTQAAPTYGGFVAPPPPGVPLGGGNATESSARPIQGDREDTFDLAPGGGGGGTAFGSANGPVYLDEPRTRAAVNPNATVHSVRKGDTLWGICDDYFHNPYQWPRIWSYNPQIQNPHWIYPNEVVRLKSGVALNAAQGPAGETSGLIRSGAKNLPPETIFLRDQGFIDDESKLNWGSITGAPEDKMFLSDFDEVYLRIGPDHEVRLGQELTVFRPVRDVPNGQVIAIQGTARVDQWNPQTRIARAQIVETLDTIERGARIGPVGRKFEVVAPARNAADVHAHVLVAVRPHNFYGQGQVVFLDKGADDGLRTGNRLFIVRHGDAWRRSMASERTADRIMIEREATAEIERVPRVRNEQQTFPEEVVGELRVLNVQKKSATCYVTASRGEIEPGDEVVARKGY